MKRILLLIICACFFMVGCNKTVDVSSIIEERDNLIVAIHYPTTGFKKLDSKINDFVYRIYDDIKREVSGDDRTEINIDYLYTTVNDRYHSVLIKVFSYNPGIGESNYVNTFVYDSEINKVIQIDDLMDSELINKMISNIKNNLKSKYSHVNSDIKSSSLLFTLDEQNINFYFNPINNGSEVAKISFPIKEAGINVVPKDKVTVNELSLENRIISVDSKVVALTFDDGPSYYTHKIIEYLKEENVVATFFVLGNKVSTYSETLKRLIEYGNEIGNHTYSHKLLTRLKEDEIKSQINRTQDEIKQYTGYTPKLLRPSYGSANKKIRNSSSLNIVLWDVDTLDWRIKSSKKIASRALKKIRDKDIVLMHDTYERTLKALKIMIPQLKEEGYTFVTVSELYQLKVLSNVRQ